MKQALRDDPSQVASFSLSRNWRLLDLLRNASARTRHLTAVAVVVAWVPLAILSALRGWTTFVSFLTDYASQSRFLILLPVLILAAPGLNRRHGMVAQHLEIFVPQEQISRYQANWTSFERLCESRIAQFMIVLLTYALAVWLEQYVSPEGTGIVFWWKGGGGFQWLSPAGAWGVFISYPILVFFALLWLWRQLLWTRFMRSACYLDLCLIAAHPDCVGGLGFLESALRGQVPFSFCLGAALAGAVANRVLHHGEKLVTFSEITAVLVGAVLAVCVVPYFAFTPVLMRMRRHGLVKYGILAHTAGEMFEKKWLEHSGNFSEDVLAVSDFAAVHNLYGIAGNVNNVRMLPVGRIDLYFLLVAAFIPAIPVVIGSIPLATVAHAILKLLF